MSVSKRDGKKVYLFDPVGLDIWDRGAFAPDPGILVHKVQPHGCPKNGTMGHCYVVPDDGTGNQYGALVLEASLKEKEDE
jgi:hypothetical protein